MNLFQLLPWLELLALASPLSVLATPLPINGTSLAIRDATAKQSFQSTCVGCGLIGGPQGTRLACSCKNNVGKYGMTYLKLNNCIGNGDGALAWNK